MGATTLSGKGYTVVGSILLEIGTTREKSLPIARCRYPYVGFCYRLVSYNAVSWERYSGALRPRKNATVARLSARLGSSSNLKAYPNGVHSTTSCGTFIVPGDLHTNRQIRPVFNAAAAPWAIHGL